MTSLQEQKRKQKQWVPVIESQFTKHAKKLVLFEFQEDVDNKTAQKNFENLIKYCLKEIPYYQSQSELLNDYLISKSKSNEYLPILSKKSIQNNENLFRPLNAPNNLKATHLKSTSGSTGKPLSIDHSHISEKIFGLLKQREYRWFDFNPLKTLASIRLPNHLPSINGKYLELQNEIKLKGWPYFKKIYKTGSFLGYSVFNSIDDQLNWLNDRQPDYLISYAESLEHLALGNLDQYQPNNLKSVLSISETLSSDMAQRIHKTFDLPIHQNYGLNELGLVASKCPEGGRYHVHREYYHVEIVDEQGRACKPGEIGKILVSNFSNPLMPLLRYDTDDLAYATDQNCPCGRKLPCFGEVIGRYSRIAFLPKGTLEHVAVIKNALTESPPHIEKQILKFQIHQTKSNLFILKLVLRNQLNDKIMEFFKSYWDKKRQNIDLSLEIRQIESLEIPQNGKFQDFTSDYYQGLK